MTETTVATDPKMYPLTAAARKRGCQPATLRNAILRKRLPAKKLGRDWFLTLEDLDAYLTNRWRRNGRRTK